MSPIFNCIHYFRLKSTGEIHICIEYAFDMQKYAFNMYKYAENMHKICKEYAENMDLG